MATLILHQHHLLLLLLLLNPAIAAPIPPPDLSNCQPAIKGKTGGGAYVTCCIPIYFNNNNNDNDNDNEQEEVIKIIDFTPPSFSKIRVRTAAHLVHESYVAKYSKAVGIMRSLPPNHPWSHYQQANVHCAYCQAAYNVTGYPLKYMIHRSWLFFPFHRMYIYFYERILGKLIGDDSFALPFWNWDAPDGMTMPQMYANSTSPLFDPLRNQNHYPPKILDILYDNATQNSNEPVNLVEHNLVSMYRQMVRASTAKLFLGSRYVPGMEPMPGPGSIEEAPHNTLHTWAGDPREKNIENMGTFYSAARDPIFYAHHANIDRMWTVWPTLPGKNRRGYEDDDDWLDSMFIFWDENLQLVRVRVRDCLDMLRLGYVYQNLSIPWVNYKPRKQGGGENKRKEVIKKGRESERVKLPARLDEVLSVEVRRPRVGRSEEEKEREEEVLVVDNIEVVKSERVRFDVYVNVVGRHEGHFTPESVDFGGSFVHLPSGMEEGPTMMMRTRFMLGLNELLGEIEGEGEDRIVVSLVPRSRGHHVKVGDVRIEFDGAMHVNKWSNSDAALEKNDQ